jgi:hypothetical protein
MMMVGHCPKCGGNIYLDEDIYGAYISCLQCGYSGGLVKAPPLAYNPERIPGDPQYYRRDGRSLRRQRTALFSSPERGIRYEQINQTL